MESCLNLKNDSYIWSNDNSIEITDKDTEECLKHTLLEHFPDGSYKFLSYKSDILDYFYYKEKKCLEYIETITPNIKKKVLKQMFSENLYDFFVTQPDIQSRVAKIIKILNSIELEKCRSKDHFYDQLYDKFKTTCIPIFLIKDKLKILSIYLFMKDYILNFNNLVNKNADIKMIISLYKEMVESKRKIFEFKINFSYKFYQSLLDLFLLTNYSNYHCSIEIKDLINKCFTMIKNLFFKTQEDKNTIKNDYLEQTMNLSRGEVNKNLKISISNIKIRLNKTCEQKHEQLLIIIASYLYLVQNLLTPLFDLDNMLKKIYDTPLIMNLFYSVMKVIVSRFQYMELDLPALIGYLNCYTVINNTTLNQQFIVDTRVKNFDDYEESISNTKGDCFLNKFNSVKYKLLNINIGLFSNPYKIFDNFALIPFANQHYSNTVTILISGFLSETSDYVKDWKHIIHNGSKYSMYYSYKWPSGSRFKMLTKVLSLKKLNPFTKGVDYFLKSRSTAKYAGKLLGIILQSRQIFKNCLINLIGFSLGSHVIKYCLKEMENNNSQCLIHNVYFCGGATTFGNKEHWKKIFANQISGRIVNCYSNVDKILSLLYIQSAEKIPIGIGPVEIESDNFTIENYDLTELNMGHLSYRDNFDKIMKKIEYSSGI